MRSPLHVAHAIIPAWTMPAWTMRACIIVACCGLSLVSTPAGAAPRNPYSGFNLSGINYGAQQWDRAQREGRRVWPYYNTPSRSVGGGTVTAGGFVGAAGGGVMQGGSVRSSPRAVRRWRR